MTDVLPDGRAPNLATFTTRRNEPGAHSVPLLSFLFSAMKYALLLLLWVAALAAPAQILTRADSLIRQAEVVSKTQNYPKAIAAYGQVLREPSAKPYYKALSYYNIACYYGLLGNAGPARENLGRAIEAGYTKADHIAVDTDLNVLHADPQWPKLLARARALDAKKVIRRPEEVQLVTTDINHFWAAYAAAQRDTAHAVAIFRREYFDKGTPGLRDYAQLKMKSYADFTHRILARPQYYNSIKQTTLAIADEKPRIVAAFRRFQELYPAVRFQHAYFVVGGWVSGGTATSEGLLLGADQTANGPGVNTSELSLLQRNRCAPVTDMPTLLVHELVHNNQGPQNGTLLSYALNEGMADFVAELVTGSLGNNARLHPYGDAHERELWAAFKQEMNGKNSDNWIANGRQETPDRPCDLGYYVGYRIVQAYYQQASDKRAALAHILTLRDPQAFLAESGYEAALARR